MLIGRKIKEGQFPVIAILGPQMVGVRLSKIKNVLLPLWPFNIRKRKGRDCIAVFVAERKKRNPRTATSCESQVQEKRLLVGNDDADKEQPPPSMRLAPDAVYEGVEL
ncbi:hypothetical protein CEXT_241831 [Caerostris extrusa]|uniref:Uncharacterized protein n=1 Tax=Caerostris extrusa TaxID=172846 RepID=A0AAV4XW38_CAEEX|nr:hypothetical protein CEXT_241831 [Caerostris extrusa]